MNQDSCVKIDLLAVKEGIRMAKGWYEGPAYEGYITGFLGPDPDALPDEEFNNELKEIIRTFWHPVGTASMSSRGAKYGVLDPDLKVKGVKGLRVADTSASVSVNLVRILAVVAGFELTVWWRLRSFASHMSLLRIPKPLCTSS
jgi:choline dehydrogenase-like flavoprotein